MRKPVAELRAAVVGAGRLGTLHARKYAAIPGINLVHVVDIDAERAGALAKEVGATPLADYRMLAVHFEGKKEVYHIKLTGPAKTIDMYKKGFDEWVKAFK